MPQNLEQIVFFNSGCVILSEHACVVLSFSLLAEKELAVPRLLKRSTGNEYLYRGNSEPQKVRGMGRDGHEWAGLSSRPR